MAPIATVTGTAIRPGISKNNRLYTAEAIGKAVARAQQRIADGGMPLTTLTHHEAGDDSTRIVGRITSMTHEADGSARYTAILADTTHGRDIHGLISGPDPVLRGVSIRGAWLGPVRRVQQDGRTVETADDLELDGLDYTRKPGVEGAGIDSVNPVPAQPRESDGTARMPIAESAPEATVTISEAATPPMSKRDSGLKGEGGPYADPGYLKDKKQRYQLDTKAHAKAAWGYINQADNARQYTSAQLKRVKARIVKALKAFGVTVATQERWLIDPAVQVTEALAECWDMPASPSNLYISLTNGPTTVTVSSQLLDAHDLDAVGRAAMAGACDALANLDPDMDADIDVPGAEPEDTDHDMDSEDDDMADAPGSACSCGCGCAVPHPMAVADGCPCACGCDVCKSADAGTGESTPETPAPEPAAETPTQEKEPAMAESTTPAAETPGSTTDSGLDALSAKFDKLTDAIAGMVTAMAAKPVEAAPAPAAPAVESAPEPVAETQEQMIARLVAEGVKAALPKAVQEHVEQSGPPTRKGLVASVAENGPAGAGTEPGFNEHGVPSDWPNKPLHTYTADERMRYFGPAVRQHVLKDRFVG
ncbi:DUF6582 domain-containing protein [Kitasatospora sp. NBC_01302]|uniref:DUF6582 domain-containing protein n=1 Tax=Kitasatospora sp. NBC_01302 TaxID=2903575 RepID=UPI002E0DB2F1|nr:hypothetical protein OG294_14380 [Kitasatospora sp. NBC_01302]